MPFVDIHFPRRSDSITNKAVYEKVVETFIGFTELGLNEEKIHISFTDEPHSFVTKVPRAVRIKVAGLDNPKGVVIRGDIANALTESVNKVLIGEKMRCVVEYLDPEKTGFSAIDRKEPDNNDS